MKTKTSSKKVPTPLSLRQSAGRSFPLAPILVVAALMALCPIQTRANTIVFDTFGPGDTYDSSVFTIGFGTGAGFREAAAQFTPLTSGILATVDLGLIFVPGTTPGSVNVFLYGDAAGSPDNADQTLLGSTTATTFPGLASLTVSGNVSVTMGSVYWLVVKPVPVSQHTGWGKSLPAVTGSTDSSLNDFTWEFVENRLPAFRITAQGVTVPDSGGTLLIMLVSVPALLVLQRVLRNERSS